MCFLSLFPLLFELFVMTFDFCLVGNGVDAEEENELFPCWSCSLPRSYSKNQRDCCSRELFWQPPTICAKSCYLFNTSELLLQGTYVWKVTDSFWKKWTKWSFFQLLCLLKINIFLDFEVHFYFKKKLEE